MRDCHGGFDDMNVQKIDKIFINNTKIANDIRKIKDVGGYVERTNVGQKEQPLMTMYYLSEHLSYLDMCVADSVYTLSMFGIDNISVGQVMRVLSGNMRQSLSSAKKNKIEESLQKLRNTEIRIDCTEEMTERGFSGEKVNMKIVRSFLPCEKISKTKYHLTDRMPLYEYAELSGQIISAPIWLLDDPGTLQSDTWDTVLIKRFLVHRLEIMKYNNDYKGRKIIYFRRSHDGENKYAGLLPMIDVEREKYASKSSWNRKIAKVHMTVTDILNYYKAKKYIQNYSVIYDADKRAIGVEIQVDVNKQKDKNETEKS